MSRDASRRQFRVEVPADNPWNNAVQAKVGRKVVGVLEWGIGTPKYDHPTVDGGLISRVVVHPDHRRQGIAAEMLRVARETFPEADIRHGKARTDDGKAWSKAVP